MTGHINEWMRTNTKTVGYWSTQACKIDIFRKCLWDVYDLECMKKECMYVFL